MANVIRRALAAAVTDLGDDEVEVVLSTAGLARDGHVLVPAGCDLTSYRRNPIILWQHMPEEPVGTASDIAVQGDKIVARVKFAPLGVSDTADRIRGLVKGGVINAVSVGFEVRDGEPLDATKPRAGQKFTAWELLEASFVSVPADTGAVVTARALEDMEHTRMTETNTRALDALRKRMLTADPAPLGKRGLSACADLAFYLMYLGWLHDDAKWEAEIEGDGSKVPAMLGEALTALGATLIAMTQEEVAELLDGHDVEVGDDGADADDAGERAVSPRLRAWRKLMSANKRAGKVLSAKNKELLVQAHDKIDEGREMLRAFIEDTDTTDVQTEDGDGDSGGTENDRAALSADFRRREIAILELSTVA